jgi:hypothetical protein
VKPYIFAVETMDDQAVYQILDIQAFDCYDVCKKLEANNFLTDYEIYISDIPYDYLSKIFYDYQDNFYQMEEEELLKIGLTCIFDYFQLEDGSVEEIELVERFFSS